MIHQRVARRYIQSRPIPLDTSSVRKWSEEIMREVVERTPEVVGDIEVPLSPGVETTLAEYRIPSENVKGEPRDIVVRVESSTADDWNDYKHSPFQGYSTKAGSTGQKDVFLVGIVVPHNMPLESFKHYDQQFYEVLSHELTHAKDLYPEDKKYESDGYYSDPYEQRAFMRQIVEEVWDYYRDFEEFIGTAYDSERELFRKSLSESQSWNAMKDELSEDDKQEMLKGIYQGIQDKKG